jgi:hypothetical protein
MAWSPQARKAAALARKRKSGGRSKPKYGVGRDGKTRLTKKQIAAKGKGKKPIPSRRATNRNIRLDKKINRTQTRAKKRINKQAARATANAFTHSTKGGIYLNARGVKAVRKGQRIHAKSQNKVAKLKAKKRKR